MKYEHVISEISKYADGIHQLSEGTDDKTISSFEKEYKIIIPASYKQRLRYSNGGEFFVLPVGTSFAGILGNSERRKGVFYLEDNFVISKRVGIPNNLFVIGEECGGEIIAFDLQRSTIDDGFIVLYDVEKPGIIDEWEGVETWLEYVFEEGNEIYDYEGNEKT